MNRLMRRIRGLVECPRCGAALASGREMIDHWLSGDPDSACTEPGFCAVILDGGPDKGKRCGQSERHTNHQVWHFYVAPAPTDGPTTGGADAR